MKYVLLMLLLLVAGCEERYRYTCQDPLHFQDEQCKHPACEFSQTCPEYLVAPILDNKINPQPPQQSQVQKCR